MTYFLPDLPLLWVTVAFLHIFLTVFCLGGLFSFCVFLILSFECFCLSIVLNHKVRATYNGRLTSRNKDCRLEDIIQMVTLSGSIKNVIDYSG